MFVEVEVISYIEIVNKDNILLHLALIRKVHQLVMMTICTHASCSWMCLSQLTNPSTNKFDIVRVVEVVVHLLALKVRY